MEPVMLVLALTQEVTLTPSINDIVIIEFQFGCTWLHI